MHQLWRGCFADILSQVYSLGSLKKMRFLGHIISVLFLFALLSCEVKMPDNIMPPEKMEAFLYDYHLIQSMSGQYSSDTYKEKLYYSYIFNKHNVEKSHFDSSMRWYNRYPKHLKRIYENLEKKLNAEIEMYDDEKALLVEGVSLDAVSLLDDSVNLWTSSRLKLLSSTALSSKLTFSFKVPDDASFVKNDSLSFSFGAYFIHEENIPLTQSAYASVRLDYADGTVFTNAVRVDTTGYYNLSAPRYSDSKLKSMSGFVYYTDNDSTAASGLLLADISVVRIHPLVKK